MRSIVVHTRFDGAEIGLTFTDDPSAALKCAAALLAVDAEEMEYASRDDAHFQSTDARMMAEAILRAADEPNPSATTVDHSYGWAPPEGGPLQIIRVWHTNR